MITRFQLSLCTTALLVGGGNLLLGTAHAQTPQTGRWQIDRYRVEVRQLTWGSLCGAAPKGHGWKVSPRRLDLTIQGDQLRFQSKRRSFTTNGCEPQGTPLKRTSHERPATGWKTHCASKDGQETVEHRFTTVDAQHIVYVTVRTYSVDPRSSSGIEDLPLGKARGAQEVWYSDGKQWRKGTRSEAQAARQCVLRVVREEKLQRLPGQDDPCATPGPVANLSLKPQSADLRAGEQHCFKVAATDNKGCPLPTPALVFGLDPPGSGQVNTRGCVTAAEDLGEAAAVALSARHGTARGSALLRLTPKKDQVKTDMATLVKRSRSARVRNLVGTVRTGSLSVHTAAREQVSRSRSHTGTTADDSASTLTGVFAAGALAMIGALVALVLAKRKRKLANQLQETEIAVKQSAEEKRRRQSQVAPMAERATLPEVGQGLVCPKCMFEFESGTFCPYDRTKLEPLDRDARHTLFIPVMGGMICPVCKTRYPTKARFCGKDRSPLIPADQGEES